MKTAFVTGATGLLGHHLVQQLVDCGWTVRALHRSPRDAPALRKIGAQPVPGDLSDLASLRQGMEGADAVFHAAALFTMWASPADFERVNVGGTANMLAAAQAECVKSFVYISAAGVVMGKGKPMRDVTEDAPLAYPSWAPYLSTKARAQELVLKANGDGFRTAVIMPPMIWGRGMHMLDNIVKNVAEGRFRWPAGGEQMMSTAHVDNVCACAILAAEKSAGGRAYFVSDGTDQSMRSVLTDLLATRGVAVKAASAPLGVAWRMATVMELLWRTFRLAGEPPLTRQMLRLVGHDFTISHQRASDELGYRPVTNWTEGLAGMRAA